MSEFTNPAGRAPEAAARYVAALIALLGDRDPLQVQRELVPRLRVLTSDLTAAELREPESEGKWSIIQVVEHLTDQETVNGFRLRSIVAEDHPPLRGYDQDRWALRLRYGSAALLDLIAELEHARRRNLRLYESLSEAELDRAGVHEERGEESARLLRTLTAGHDLAHRRQVARIRRRLGKPDLGD